MAVPTVIGTPTTSNAATSITVTLPTGSAAGDVVFAFVHTQNQALPTTAGASPKNINASDSGWSNELGAGNHYDTGGSYFCYLFSRVLNGTTGLNVPQTGDSGVLQAVTLITVRGANAAGSGEAIGVNGTTNSSTGVATITGISTGSIDRLVIGGFGLARDSATQGWNATWTDASLAGPACTGIVGNATATGNGISTGGFYGGAAASGATGTITNTAAVTSTVWEGIIIAVPGRDTPTGQITLAGTSASNTQTPVAQVALAAGVTPATRTGHILQVRARTQTAASKTTIRADLYQGATKITTTVLETAALGTSVAQYALLIPDAGAATITDYTNLSVKLWGYSPIGEVPVVEVEDVWLAIPPAGGVSHTDAPSGQLLLARGAGAEAQTGKTTPAGVLTLAGRMSEASAASSAPSGKLALAGSVAEKATRADAPAGQLLLAARIGETRTHTIAPTGSLTLGGQMVDTSSAATAPAGKLILAGAAAEASTRADARSGNVVLAGARSEASTTGSAPSGVVALAGTVAEASTTTAARAGSLVLAGARAEASTEASTPAGALVLSGRAVETFAHAAAPTGVITLAAGVRAETAVRAETSRGTLVLAGSLVDSYAVLSVTTTATGQVALAAGAIPLTRTGHSIRVRARTTAPAANVVLQAVLYQGATNISGTLTSSALTSTLAEYTLAVSDAAAASITDYTALSVKFSGYSADGETSTIQLAEMWLDIPHQSVSISHADAPSGRLTLAGRITDKLTHTGTPTGALLLAGSVIEFNIAATPSGADTPDGNLTFAGTLAGTDTQRSTPSGRLTLAGQLAQARTHADTPTGRLTLAGASTRSTAFTPAPAGTLTLAGSATTKITWSDRPAGQITLAAAVADSSSAAAARTGKITLAGAVAQVKTYTETPTGRLVFAGPISQSATRTDSPVGTIIFTGASTEHYAPTRHDTPTGAIVLAGAAADSYVFIAPDAPQIAYPTDATISDYPTSAKLATSLAAL